MGLTGAEEDAEHAQLLTAAQSYVGTWRMTTLSSSQWRRTTQPVRGAGAVNSGRSSPEPLPRPQINLSGLKMLGEKTSAENIGLSLWS